MSKDFQLDATVRTEEGKGASRRLRHANQVPAIMYGGDKAPQNLKLELKRVVKALENEAFYSHVLTITVDGEDQQAILRDLQRHPARQTPMHLDFLRVDDSQAITKRVPLHFINEEECPGVKTQGGKVHHDLNDVEVRCIPSALPEYLEADFAGLETGASIHLSDLKLPEGVELVALSKGADHDLSVAAISAPKASDRDEEETEAESE